MNLKYFYYRTYFEGYPQGNQSIPYCQKINLRQIPKDNEEHKKAREKINGDNEPLLKVKAKNQKLTTPVPAALLGGGAPPVEGLYPLQMEVQNPGLIMGGGYPHEVGYPGEFKLGFHFDHTSGLPVLPGSSVKGTLRSLWPQYDYDPANPLRYWTHKKNPQIATLQPRKADFIAKKLTEAGFKGFDTLSTPEEKRDLVHRIELAIFESWDAATLDSNEPLYASAYKRIIFFDAFPVALRSGDVPLLGRDALTPHGDNPLKNPIPLPFVKVLPGVRFEFRFRLKKLNIKEGMLLETEQVAALFSDLLETTGIGAKTNVGYGQLLALNRTKKQDHKQTSSEQTARKDATTPNRVSGTEAHPPKSKQTAVLTYGKGLIGKEVTLKILAIDGNQIQYELENITGIEPIRTIEHKSANILRIGGRYAWKVTNANPEKNIFQLNVSSFIAL